MSEDQLMTDFRNDDEKILDEIEVSGTDPEKYYQLILQRHRLCLDYERRATNDTTKYLLNTMRLNIITQMKVSVLENEVKKLTSSRDNQNQEA